MGFWRSRFLRKGLMWGFSNVVFSGLPGRGEYSVSDQQLFRIIGNRDSRSLGKLCLWVFREMQCLGNRAYGNSTNQGLRTLPKLEGWESGVLNISANWFSRNRCCSTGQVIRFLQNAEYKFSGVRRVNQSAAGAE